ncbi:hypothetical protein SynBIOSE41_02754 [Synechococcus sp. BIOS-E4-1]|nr:hypothetical protein SynBIOSE41_02754 [Synechococcus sp. BIOS-E4-1]
MSYKWRCEQYVFFVCAPDSMAAQHEASDSTASKRKAKYLI